MMLLANYVPFKVWLFTMHLVFADGQIELWQPAFPSQEACEHFKEHVVQLYASAKDVEINVDPRPCSSIDLFYDDGSV